MMVNRISVNHSYLSGVGYDFFRRDVRDTENLVPLCSVSGVSEGRVLLDLLVSLGESSHRMPG